MESLGQVIRTLKRKSVHHLSSLLSVPIIYRSDGGLSTPLHSDDRHLAALYQDGFVNLGNLGIDIGPVAEKASRLFDRYLKDKPEVEFVAIKNPFLMSPVLEHFLRNERINRLMTSYLGSDAVFDKLTVYRIQACAAHRRVSGRWHHDRVGRRIQMWVLLHDVDETRRPTLFAAGSHRRRIKRNDYRASRFDDAEVLRSCDRIVRLTGKMGDVILMDTNGLHRASQEEGQAYRDILCFGYSSFAKASSLEKWAPELPIGIGEELFPLSFKAEGTLLHRASLQRERDYWRYGTRLQLVGQSVIEGAECE